jgi:peptidoglycan/xylan/chitin deacetylase (PgdA/CDA1 family)
MADRPSNVPPVGEVRLPGMDQALYSYRGRAETPAFVWPGGARIAFAVTLMLEYRELATPEGESRDPRLVSPLGNFSPDWLTWSQHLYGNRVGIFRVLDVLDRYGLVPSVALGAEAARRHPELVDELASRGAGFHAHGTFASRRITSRMSAAAQRAHIAESRDAVAKAAGRPPLGWAGQDYNESPDTPALLAEAGFTWTTDWSNDDRPYRLGQLVSLPAHSEYDDVEAMWLRRISPQAWAASIAEGVEVLHGEGGAVFNLTLHPWVAGQAHRIRYLDQALAAILGKAGIWRAGLDEIAAAAAAQL